MLRGLIHHWRINLAVAAGAAVATAVLSGAVIVGDSLRASLRQLTLDRLGAIDWALVAEQPFRATLATDLEAAAEIEAAPVLMATASALHTESRALAGGISLLGIDERFTRFYTAQGGELAAALARRDGQIFPSVAINRSLARQLAIEIGEDLLLSFEQPADIPRESLLGSRPREGDIAALRATVTVILPDRGPGRFALAAHQESGGIAYVDLGLLQSRLDRRDRANALLVSTARTAEPPATADGALAALLQRTVTFEDLGLEVAAGTAGLRLSSRRFVLRDSTVDTVERVAAAAGLPSRRLLGYLANRMTHGGRSIPYSMVLGLDIPVGPPLAPLETTGGEALGPLESDDIVLGRWAAEDLGVRAGDSITLDYFAVGGDDALVEESAELRVAAIAAMTGLMVDGAVLPDFPGIAEADDIAGWEPPFPMDLGLIRPRDEEFWDDHGAAPKALLSLATAQRLWANRFGRVTALAVAAPSEAQEAFLAALRRELEPAAFGMSLEAVKRRGLEASSGATDFAGLFLAFSVFLIAAAGLVVGLLFSLSVELRTREVGLRRAVGFPLAAVRRQLLLEGLAVALAGAVLGVALAVVYATALIHVIARLWSGMLDLPLLVVEVRVPHVAAAVTGALAMVATTIALTLRRLRRVAIPAQLAGVVRPPGERGGRRARRLSLLALLAAAGLLATALAVGSSPLLFFAGGALLLVAGLAAFAGFLDRTGGALGGRRAADYVRMAARNGAFHPPRSVLSVALVGCATFMLVAVAANRRELRPEALGRDSGTGGFTLVAQADVPLRASLSGGADAAELGLGEEARAALARTEVYALRLRPGDDASCLNLYQPETPRVVGVPDDLVARGGFTFASTVAPRDNPWELLDEELGEGVVPAFGDANSVTWILHSGLGEELELVDDHGRSVRLRLVGLLSKSIFQSELLISEAAFVRHFPEHGGYRYFLLQTAPETSGETAAVLESSLSRYGFDAITTTDKLARFLGIEEMYLSTFQLLGGLGLALGTVGLGVVLVRNVNERRGELAMLRAVGFRRRSIAGLILLETGVQLAAGLTIGAASGLLALLPFYLDTSLHLPWGSLAATLATVVAVGMLSAAAGVAAALRAPLLPALKAD